MAQKVTESVKGMDQKAETVAEVGKGLEGSAFQSSVSRGLLRGRKVRVSLVSTDAGGYDLLDIVFNGADSVELWRKPYSMKDEKGKITASGFTYSVVSLDEDETVYTAQVKPSRKSDKALLEKIIELSMRSIAREEE